MEEEGDGVERKEEKSGPAFRRSWNFVRGRGCCASCEGCCCCGGGSSEVAVAKGRYGDGRADLIEEVTGLALRHRNDGGARGGMASAGEDYSES